MSKRLLPSRSLPYNVLRLIHEYSKPLTRTDWRKSKPIITSFYIYKMVQNTPIFLSPLIYEYYADAMVWVIYVCSVEWSYIG
jgi:hypothetical protein